MNTTTRNSIGIVIAVAAFGVLVGYWIGHRAETGASKASSGEKQVLYWFDPMYPNQHFDKPGKSPFMDMQLVPKYADEAQSGAEGINIDASIVQNVGLRLATVERTETSQSVNAVGSVVFDQRLAAVVQARTNGFVDRVYGRALGDMLHKGAPLVDVLVPEWAGAQEEYLALQKANDPALIAAARERLRLLGMTPELVDRIEKERRPFTSVTVYTPVSGAIESLEVREGMTIAAGATLAKVNGLRTVWLEAAISETEGAAAIVGKQIEATLTAYPGKIFKGSIIALLPEANAETRTLRVRIELKNADLLLRPGMFAQVKIDTSAPALALTVPSEAVIRSGKRNVVIVSDEQNRFVPQEVEIGGDMGDRTIVLGGLQEGQKIVASGQFLIDSEASLRGVLARMGSMSQPSPSSTHTVHHATGTIESIEASRVVLSHAAVPSLSWPAMTMGFKIGNEHQLHGLKSGDRVAFSFEKQGKDFVITEVRREGAQP